MSKDDFFYHTEDEIRELVRREKEEDKKREEEENEKREQKKIEELKRSHEREKTSMISRKEEVLEKSLEVLAELEQKTDSYNKIEISNLFIDVGDHKEINPIFLNLDMLKYIDLSLVSFKNVKVSGIDFQGCNINLNPQEVYNKDLSGCNFEGLHIPPFMDFRGVDIRGARFSQDNNPLTLNILNTTFLDAIYDETTTYNGIPFIMFYKNEEERLAK